ncbi:MAG: vanadium-dependent haloperoxidase [Steroidobacteraceae bacterium]|nr:vanadium-dependent haloperoxidase [Steroidobacteraceae bacterium]
MRHSRPIAALAAALALVAGHAARGDAVTDWNIRAGEIILASGIGTPPANRVMAVVQTAVYEAVNRITAKYPENPLRLAAAPGASIEAAVAAAGCAVLRNMVPAQSTLIDRHCAAALDAIADGPARDAGVAIGAEAAEAVLAMRSGDQAMRLVPYRPATSPGTYVPTTMPVVPQWPQRLPWLMESASQFRPGPPPALESAAWARDYNEVKALGAQQGSTRTDEQTAIAQFWAGTLPTVYHGIVRSVADQPGRDPTRNARLFAAVTQAMDDALIAVFEAKYHYNFWRPVTAIRNGDADGNDATAPDGLWLPLIDTPMHPEYPCAHCILAAAVGTVLAADVGDGPMPTLTTRSDVTGSTRSWATTEQLIREVSLARIYDGVHYRSSTEAGTAMGRMIGALAARKFLAPR